MKKKKFIEGVLNANIDEEKKYKKERGKRDQNPFKN